MYKQVREPVTYGRRRLIKLIETRKLVEFIEENDGFGMGSDKVENTHMKLYCIAVGNPLPSYPIIFNLRRIIRPEEWFYLEGEPLPPEKEYNLKHGWYDYDSMAGIETVGINRLRNLQDTARETARKAGLNKQTIYDLQRKVKRDGGAVYHTRPSARVVMMLRGIVPPDEWFYFMDEKAE